MFNFEEKNNRNYSPGDIIYADANGSDRYNCFGVVIDRDFWIEQAQKEALLKGEIEYHQTPGNKSLDEMVLFRVLGIKAFRLPSKSNNPEETEPDEHAIMHYRIGGDPYITPVNLRPIIETSKKDNKRVGRLLFSGSDSYVLDALEDAEVVYNYLDGERFDQNNNYFQRRDKLLRLLEKAIPIKK